MENEASLSDENGQRTLAAVVFTDGVRFSARMSVDENHTLELIRRDLSLMKRVCDRFGGRVLKSTGDGLLMCFSSAVQAVECAVEIQRSLAELASRSTPDDVLQHRIGIHLGDVFFTERDVMGNGVNIAARLQTEAEPGGICLSQTVHDVVKHGLSLETLYLGRRTLKNIREGVSVYKICLPFLTGTIDAYDAAVQRLGQHDNLPRIKKLILYACKQRWESDPLKLETLDLKGLLQELQRRASTPERLSRLLHQAVGSLSKWAEYNTAADTIVTELQSLYLDHPEPTETVTETATETATEDATELIASPPLSVVPVSDEEEALTSIVSIKTASTRDSHNVSDQSPNPYRKIATVLESHDDSLRIKKLLIYSLKFRWENDASVLQQLDVSELLQSLHQNYASLEPLKTHLYERVRSLSKQTEYARIAEIILSYINDLYASSATTTRPDPSDTTVVSRMPIFPGVSLQDDQTAIVASGQEAPDRIAQALIQHPQAIRIKKLLVCVSRNCWENDQSQLDRVNVSGLIREVKEQKPTLEHLQTALYQIVNTLNKQADYRPIAEFMLQTLAALYSDLGTPVPPAAPPAIVAVPSSPVAPAAIVAPVAKVSPPPSPVGTKASVDLVTIRLQVMKYANPLRAKILLFSALHHEFTFSQQDWLALRMYDLEGLLQSLLKDSPTVETLEATLKRAAQRLADPEENAQVIGAIIRAARPLYGQGRANLELLLPMQAQWQIEDQTRVDYPNPVEDEDHTCQLFSAPVGQSLPPANAPASAVDSTQLLPFNRVLSDSSLSDSDRADSTQLLTQVTEPDRSSASSHDSK